MADTLATSIAHPGANWRMHWLDGGVSNLQLDIVGFLAILEEGSVRRTSKLASLSWTFLLPRPLPAPHSLLYVERPERLDTVKAQLNGVRSGNHKDYMTHIAAVLFDYQLPSFAVQCIRIQRNNNLGTQLTTRMTAPVVLVNLFGCGLSIMLFILSLIYGDGMSMIATILLSLLSTLVGINNRWALRLLKRRNGLVPDGTTVIRWPNGSFQVIKTDEDAARQLFFMPDNIEYTMLGSAFIPGSMLGTIVLMFSVIALANAKIELRIAWAGGFILLNAGHWIAAALPRRLNWDISAFEMKEEYLATGQASPGYTEALWKTIVLTKSVEWVKQNDAAPDTPVWNEWLRSAETQAKRLGKAHSNSDVESGVGQKLRQSTTWRNNDLSAITWDDRWAAKAEWESINQEAYALADGKS